MTGGEWFVLGYLSGGLVIGYLWWSSITRTKSGSAS